MDEIFIIIGLILLNGLFSMSETALISARKSRLAQEAARGNTSARTALKIANDPDSFLSTIQIGITLIGILTGLYSGAKLASACSEVLTGWGVSAAYARTIAQTAIVVVVTYLSIVVGELVPKRIALSCADTIAKIVSRPMRLLSMAALPLVWLLSVSTGFIIRLLHLRKDETRVTESDVKSIINDGAASGEVQQVEKEIMNRALMMGDQRVSSIMTCRKDIATLAIDMTPAQIRQVLAEELHNSYPVVDTDRESVRGMVSLKDLVLKLDSPGFDLAAVVHPGVFIPESMTAYTALEHLKTKRAHCLIVCDEFGVMQGVVTLNDILDGLVGTVADEPGQPMIVPRDDGTSWFADGQCPVYDFMEYFDKADLYEPASYSTLGGLVLENLRKLPTEGETTCWRGFRFEVADMDGARIDKLIVTLMPE